MRDAGGLRFHGKLDIPDPEFQIRKVIYIYKREGEEEKKKKKR